MGTPDPILGISVDFPLETFEAGVRFAMQMGVSNDPDKRPKFVRKSTSREYWKDGAKLWPYDGTPIPLSPAPTGPPRTDRDGNPLDPDIEVRRGADTVVTTPRVTVNGTVQANTADCALEIVKADADELPPGNFRPTKAVVTVLASDYAAIQGCQEMRYNGDVYQFGYEPETDGLFGADVSQLIFYCLDDS